jgi:uncharacterized 2Fe-2S/4Fe-4S cluster protein (DUF4445 family)
MSITVSFRSEDGAEGRFSAADSVGIADAAALCGLDLEFPCGARGCCTGCRVRFDEGAPEPTTADLDRLTPEQLRNGWRLACQTVVTVDATVEIPRGARSVPAKSFGEETLPVATQAAPDSFGFAVDVGTTTIAVAICDLATTRVIASGSTLNPQVRFGPDVISRIQTTTGWSHGSDRLAAAVRQGVSDVAEHLRLAAGIDPDRITDAVICGNAFETHTLLGEPVEGLGQAPYLGRFVDARAVPFDTLGLAGRTGARARVMPQIRSHVGGDAVAAMLAVGLGTRRGAELLIDLGTNTEIVATDGTRVVAASAAAGPAFEGGGITCGMRATDGAIDRVALDPTGHLLLRVIGGGAPAGICGTGLCDGVATLLDAGLVDAAGRLARQRGTDPSLPLWPFMFDAPRATHGVRLANGPNGDVVLTARDVRQLQLVKGSIAAGVGHLLERLDVRSEELRRVHLAGAFGSVIRKETAVRIGLLPEIDPERIHAVGDAAAAGARLALCDPAAFDRGLEVARSVEHVELARDLEYMERFAAAMRFPVRPAS